MKKNALSVIFVLCIFIIAPSCKVSYPVKFLDLNEKIISKKTKWVLLLEDQSGFLVEGKNLSQDTLSIRHDNKNTAVPPQDSFNIQVGQGSSAELVNASDTDMAVRIKINYYRTNLIQEVYESRN